LIQQDGEASILGRGEFVDHIADLQDGIWRPRPHERELLAQSMYRIIRTMLLRERPVASAMNRKEPRCRPFGRPRFLSPDGTEIPFIRAICRLLREPQGGS
jgi:hypothetical protein